ncbi:MAG: valine--tRNA ligase [Ruminococcaceae bacterium]|nr:valine--tRNA ligase [Oscillospiraceae bacterium]
MKELEKKYNPADFEERLYTEWETKGYFQPSGNKDAEAFSIVMPPPNITGQLHMGHALDNTLQDILVRYKRMCGCDTLWLPGTDHASIATEAKIVEAMRKEGISKEDLGREGFLERAWDWNNTYGNRICEQLKKLGSSCDWSRKRFTLDDGCSEAVKEVFVKLYNDGLIYRGTRIINWCPHCKTSISDAEVEYKDMDGNFWHIRYPVKDSDEFVYLATTRPETLLGDTAVAVNPKDERYAHLIGKTLILPLVGREIPVVADEYVEMDFGTGCVKITPAHDPNDFEVGMRHDLPLENMLTDDAKVTENYPKYAGMDRYEARKAIVKDLEEGGFLVRIEPIKHNVGTCYRCGTVIEPRASLQWFVSMKPLAVPAIDAVKTGEIRFIPDRFSKNYLHWMENIRDWCISRQLWWGHRIPAFYCDDCGELVVTKDESAVCPKCGKAMRQDPDTLDTWFSSALWPFSTMGWPNVDAEDLKRYYPTNTLVTGYDIITFWVSRMIFSGYAHTDKKPFTDVFIHGLVRDALGRKMSKSLGNGIDPLEVIKTYGADALRFTLATGNSPGNDMRISDERFEASRNFANKIWNAARFVMMNLDRDFDTDSINTANLAEEDKWVISLYNRLVGEVRDNLEKYELGMAVSKLYDFIWDIFCDWYIELVKPRLAEKETETNLAAQATLTYVLSNTLKLLHPFMPFITEEIWLSLPHKGESIMVSDYPNVKPELDFPEAERNMEIMLSAIRAIRNRRAEMNVPPKRTAKVIIVTAEPSLFADKEPYFKRLASASEIVVTDKCDDEGTVRIVTDACEIFLPLADIVDTDAERQRLTKELQTVESEIKRAEGKLSNAEFVAKAPEKLVNAEKEKLEKFKALAEKLKASIASL